MDENLLIPSIQDESEERNENSLKKQTPNFGVCFFNAMIDLLQILL